MATLLQKLSKLATQTFSQRQDKNFQDNFVKLGELMKQVKPVDLGFNVREYFKHDDYVPTDRSVDFVGLEFNDTHIMGIFVLYKGTHLSLHDHPNMYGLIKVIHGRVRIDSYSHVPGNTIVEANRSEAPLQYNATSNPSIEVSAEDDTVLAVTPVDNFHEIQPVDGGAAFMDILSPPYDDNRFCHYYKVKRQTSSGEAVLKQVPHVYDP